MKKGSVVKLSQTAAHNFSLGDSQCASALMALRSPTVHLFNFVSILDDLRIPLLTSTY